MTRADKWEHIGGCFLVADSKSIPEQNFQRGFPGKNKLAPKEDCVAKIRKCKLSWNTSDSDHIVGYKLYWSTGNKVSYDSNFIELGKVREVNIPDVLEHVPSIGESIFFGIAAVDKNGNESDITTLAEAFTLTAPPAPVDFFLDTRDDFDIIETIQETDDPSESDFSEEDLKELALMAEPLLKPAPVSNDHNPAAR
jgi:hypothetical protein